jgi:hypothetical protein
MQCMRCKTEQEVLQKFCNECGAAMGLTCDRCGTVNRMEARHCGACGQPLVASLQEGGAAAARHGRPLPVRQYTTSEIEELLILRRVIKAGEESAKILTQNEIDNLF